MESRKFGTTTHWNFSKGYGFVTLDNGDDVFVHCTAILGDSENKSLFRGQEVELSVVETARGLQGKDVLPLSEEFVKD